MSKRKQSDSTMTQAQKRARNQSGYSNTGARAPMYATVARTRGAIVQEMNYFDSALIDKIMTATSSWGSNNQHDPSAVPVANINCLFAPTQGTTVSSRLGRKVFVHRIRIKGSLYQPGLALAGDPGASPQQLVRLILFQDTQTNAAQVGAATLMTAAASNIGAVLNSFQNKDQVGRFKVLKDKTYTMPSPDIAILPGTPAVAYQQGVIRPFKLEYRWKTPLQVNFNALTAGTVGDIVDHSFHLYGQCTSQASPSGGNGTAPQLNYTCRTYFKE